jgi:outer membrane biosynthesis protein TonB
VAQLIDGCQKYGITRYSLRTDPTPPMNRLQKKCVIAPTPPPTPLVKPADPTPPTPEPPQPMVTPPPAVEPVTPPVDLTPVENPDTEIPKLKPEKRQIQVDLQPVVRDQKQVTDDAAKAEQEAKKEARARARAIARALTNISKNASSATDGGHAGQQQRVLRELRRDSGQRLS